MAKIKGCFTTIGVVVVLFIGGLIALTWLVPNPNQDNGGPNASREGAIEEDASIAAIATDPELARLDASARAIPADQHEENLQAYRQLLERVPDSARYQSKVAHYARLVDAAAKEAPRAILPKFEVYDEEIYDAPIKTQVVRYVLVPEKASREQISALIESQYRELRQRRGFRYAETPTHVGVYVYDARDRAESQTGGQVAHTFMVDASERSPRIEFNENFWPHAWGTPKVVAGRAEDERVAIFQAIVRAQDRAASDAARTQPQDIHAQVELARQLEVKYLQEVYDRFGISAETAKAIEVEGATKEWPLPALGN